MRVGAVVEIQQNGAGEWPVTLLERAYTASRAIALALVVAPGLRAAVDRELDPIVPRSPLQIFGVRYFDANDDDVITLARTARVVVASSPSLCERLTRSGVEYVGAEEGFSRLARFTDA